MAQPCPVNIDFSDGTLKHWDCATGNIDRTGQITLPNLTASPDRQQLIPSSTFSDYYSDITLASPAGDAYILKLGNELTNAQAEQASYTYTIPANKDEYTFVYYYALVIQDPAGHAPFEMPQFAVKLTDATKQETVDCGTHNFVPSQNLNGFLPSKIAGTLYHDWATVVLKITGRAGHTMRLDFTTNDCSRGGHFCYAYLSFEPACNANYDLIKGNNYCAGSPKISLTGPPGYDSYVWHTLGNNQALAYSRTYTTTDIPADGTQYVVDVASNNAGCPTSFSTTIHKFNEIFNLQVASSAEGCEQNGLDLTDPKLILQSSANMVYEYYDPNGNRVYDPKHIVKTGIYYIRGTNNVGCTDIQPIQIVMDPPPAANIKAPAPVCYPGTVDITTDDVTSGHDDALKYTYYSDAQLQQPLLNPKAITITGTYYIKMENHLGCYQVFQVPVVISPPPEIKPAAVTGCAPLNIDDYVYKTGDTYGLTYKYWKDASATIPLTDPVHITESGTYYKTVLNAYGCTALKPEAITVTINPAPVLSISTPKPVTYPVTINLAGTFPSQAGYTYTYWYDAKATKPVPNYNAIDTIGTFYIKAVNQYGCEVTKPVHVVVNSPDLGGVEAPTVFTPNGDGINDEFTLKTKGITQFNYIKIYNRNGTEVFAAESLDDKWRGVLKGKPVPTGTYYWVCSCFDIYRKKTVIDSGSITVVR